jgi:hypothetical protein
MLDEVSGNGNAGVQSMDANGLYPQVHQSV